MLPRNNNVTGCVFAKEQLEVNSNCKCTTSPFPEYFTWSPVAETFARRLALTPEEIKAGIRTTREKVQRRVKLFRGDRPWPEMAGRPVIVVDDGLASGYTLLTAVEALRHKGADNRVVAGPTGHDHALSLVAPLVEGLYCANVRGGLSFAVAEAYRQWSDVNEEEIRHLL
jgi:putative phosphoribosyl transferase